MSVGDTRAQPGEALRSVPSTDQVVRADRMIAETPRGPRAVDVAMSFVERYGASEPELISAWPSGSGWNPLIVRFFDATDAAVRGDDVPWCAAFANWCIRRAGGTGTGSAGSQSFLSEVALRSYRRAERPGRGDIVVFTCFDQTSGARLGLGHVGFLTGPLGPKTLTCVSGDVRMPGCFSRIAEVELDRTAIRTERMMDGRMIPVVLKPTAYLAAA